MRSISVAVLLLPKLQCKQWSSQKCTFLTYVLTTQGGYVVRHHRQLRVFVALFMTPPLTRPVGPVCVTRSDLVASCYIASG